MIINMGISTVIFFITVYHVQVNADRAGWVNYANRKLKMIYDEWYLQAHLSADPPDYVLECSTMTISRGEKYHSSKKYYDNLVISKKLHFTNSIKYHNGELYIHISSVGLVPTKIFEIHLMDDILVLESLHNSTHSHFNIYSRSRNNYTKKYLEKYEARAKQLRWYMGYADNRNCTPNNSSSAQLDEYKEDKDKLIGGWYMIYDICPEETNSNCKSLCRKMVINEKNKNLEIELNSTCNDNSTVESKLINVKIFKSDLREMPNENHETCVHPYKFLDNTNDLLIYDLSHPKCYSIWSRNKNITIELSNNYKKLPKIKLFEYWTSGECTA